MVIGAAPIVSLLTKSVYATGLKIGGSVLEKSVCTKSATWLPGLNFLCVVRFSILNSPSGCPPFRMMAHLDIAIMGTLEASERQASPSPA